MAYGKLLIDGEDADSVSGKTATSLNPANGEIYAHVAQACTEDALLALSSSERAFANWRSVAPSSKEALFLKLADRIESRQDELVEVLVGEAGSTLMKANYEVHLAAEFARGIAGECRRVGGDTYASDYPGVSSYSIRQPLGVVVAISPFNYPLLLGIRKIGWAIAAGNCVVLKPSEVTPVVGLKIGALFRDAGFPPGVLNVIPGDGNDLGRLTYLRQPCQEGDVYRIFKCWKDHCGQMRGESQEVYA